MKYKVSVIKKIAFLVMTMALAVAMVACSGAAGTPGPAGPPGKDAPTPDPTTPTTPTTPTEPTGGAAPEVTKMFPDVYLTLAGSGDKDRSFTLREHFADIDSLLKYTVTSSDATIATAAVTDGVLKVTAVKDGNTTITVTAADDEGLMTAVDDFSVTVVKTNAPPTTHGLNITDRTTLLEKRLYYRDGLRSHTVTVVSNPGAAGSVTDSILVDDFNVVIGKETSLGVDDPKDNKITVTVMKVGAHSYRIDITPNATGFGGEPKQTVKIYPKDKFRAMVTVPWTFDAMYNTPPKALTTTFHLELTRSAGAAAIAPKIARDIVTITAGAAGAGATGLPGNVGRINISDYFILSSLDIVDPVGFFPDGGAAAVTAAVTATTGPMINKVGDTVCTVSPKTSERAVVQLFNEAGVALVSAGAVAHFGDAEEVPNADYFVAGDQALYAIRIDSRFKDLGEDKIQTDTVAGNDAALYADYLKDKDALATATGTIPVTISCADKDETAIVTGTVVVR